MRGAARTAALLPVAAAAQGVRAVPADRVPLVSATSAGFAAAPPATCNAGGTATPAPQPLMWNVLYEPVKEVAHGNDLSGMNGVAAGVLLCVYPAYWNQSDLSSRGFPTSVSSIWPSLAGPWCDKAKDPDCKPEYIKHNGGCPQAVDMDAHKAALKTGLDAQVPSDFGGYVSYDMEGWDGVAMSNTSGYAQQCGGQAAFEAAARNYFTVTMETVKALRPKAKFGFYGRPMKEYGGRGYDFPLRHYADSLREHNDQLMWFFNLVDFIQPSLYIDNYQPNGTDAVWPHRSDFVRATMAECERISNLTGGKPILPQSNYQYFGQRGWPFMNRTVDIVDSLLAPFEFPHTVGVGVWGDDDAQHQPANRTAQNQQFIDETLAPIVNDFTAKSCACAASKCSGHGRCYLPLKPYPAPEPPAPHPAPGPAPHPAPGPAPHPGPAPGPATCVALMGKLAGPDVVKNTFCHIPVCRDPAGCPANATRCAACVQFDGAHAEALRAAGCTAAEAAQFCDDMGKPPAREAPAGAYTGGMFGDDSLCFCDDGYSGADCSRQDRRGSAAEPAARMVAPATASGSAGRVMCLDGRSSCPAGSTCAALSTGGWGCCGTPDAVPCDCSFCCPKGYACARSGDRGSATHCERNATLAV